MVQITSIFSVFCDADTVSLSFKQFARKNEFLCIGPVVSLSVNQSVTWSLPTLSDNLQLIFLVWSSASSRKK